LSFDILYTLKLGPTLALSHIDYIMYMFYLQQLAYRLMEGSAIIIYRKCTSNNALSMKE